MKKKFLSLVLAICFIVPCAFMLVACGNKGFETGVKYTLSDVKMVWASEEEKNEILDGITEEELLSNYSTGAYITFDKDGSLVAGTPVEGQEDRLFDYYYTKEGKSILIYDDQEKTNKVIELTIDGDKLLQKLGNSGYESYVLATYTK